MSDDIDLNDPLQLVLFALWLMVMLYAALHDDDDAA
jgi:hypothetical protein